MVLVQVLVLLVLVLVVCTAVTGVKVATGRWSSKFLVATRTVGVPGLETSRLATNGLPHSEGIDLSDEPTNISDDGSFRIRCHRLARFLHM